MADDPTVQFSLRRTRECPTCGHNTQPSEIECSLCGTTLPSDFHSAPPPQSPLEPSVVDSPPAEASEPTLVAPAPSRPQRGEEEPVKAATPTPAASRRTRSKEATNASVRQVAPPSPPSPPPPRPAAPTSAVSEPPPVPRAIPRPVPRPPVQPQANALTKWGGVVAGALALFLMSFVVAKLFSSSPEKPAPPELRTESVVTEVDPDVTIPEPKTAPTPPPAPPPPVQLPQRVGLVTTAEQLLPIRIFGAEPSDDVRGVGALRTQVEAMTQGVREVYNTQLETNPQTLGAVVLELTIAPEGQVADVAVHVTGSLNGALQLALLERAKALRFAPVQGEAVKVFYPLLLSPEKVEPATLVAQVKEVWPGRYKVLAATPVSVRAEANDTAQEVGTIGPGLFLSVVSSQDGWLGALSPKGKVGYVRRDAIFPRVENTGSADARG